MNKDDVDYLTMSKETTDDVVITVRREGKLVKVGWASLDRNVVSWTEASEKR